MSSSISNAGRNSSTAGPSDTRVASQQKPLCRVILKDDSIIEIFDEKTIRSITVLHQMRRLTDYPDGVMDVPLKQFNPECVRFFFMAAFQFKDSLNLPEEGELMTLSADMDLMEVREIADFLNCETVLIGLRMIIAWNV